MRIAISTRRITDPVHGEARDALSEDWYHYLFATWPETVLLPLVNMPDQVTRWATELQIEAAILTNGNDWGESRARDDTERALVDWCLENGRPVLGVCRGFHVLNALYGGQVETDIRAVCNQSHGGTRHPVSITSPAFLEIAGGDRIDVNSYHNQGVTEAGLADRLTPFARSEGGVIEAFHHETAPVLGIQWHPERPGAPNAFDKMLIGNLLANGAFWTET